LETDSQIKQPSGRWGRRTAYDTLSVIDDMSVHDLGRDPCGIVTFSHASLQASEIANRLLAQECIVSVSEHYGTRQPSDPWKLPNMIRVAPHYMVRAAPHYFSTCQEISDFAAKIASIVSRL